MTSRRCTTPCENAPMAVRPGMRSTPWTKDDSGLQFFQCKRCGQISIQKFDPLTGYGQIWSLTADSIVLFQISDTPAVLLKYVLTDDFHVNFSICDQLFAGILRELGDLSYPMNAVLVDMQKHDDPLRITQMLQLLHIVLHEVIERRGCGREVRCSIASLDVVERFAKGLFRTGATDPQAAAELRCAAVGVFELLAMPDMEESVRDAQNQVIENMVDHAMLLVRSQADVQAARQRIHSDGVVTLETEARFLLSLFGRRGAWLTETHASLFWGCLRDLHGRLESTVTGKGSVRQAYQAIQKLLEQQLVSLGLEKADEGFVNREQGFVVKIREGQPVVVVYRLIDATNPLKVFDAWHDVHEFVTSSRAPRGE